MSPLLAGYLLTDPNSMTFSMPFIIAGALKCLYDILLWLSFRLSQGSAAGGAGGHDGAKAEPSIAQLRAQESEQLVGGGRGTDSSDARHALDDDSHDLPSSALPGREELELEAMLRDDDEADVSAQPPLATRTATTANGSASSPSGSSVGGREVHSARDLALRFNLAGATDEDSQHSRLANV